MQDFNATGTLKAELRNGHFFLDHYQGYRGAIPRKPMIQVL
jgi:hypothetical protein